MQLHGQAGGARAADEVGDVGERRLRGERQLVVLAAQHPEQPPDLGQRVAPGLLHGGERERRPGGLCVDEPRGAVGVDDHPPQGAGDDVVQLGGDPRALLGHRLLGPRLGVLLAAAAAQGARQAGAVAQQPAREHRRGDDHEPAPDDVQPIVGGRVEDGQRRDERDEPADPHGEARGPRGWRRSSRRR